MQGVKFIRKFKQLLNPLQVFDLGVGGPAEGYVLDCALGTECSLTSTSGHWPVFIHLEASHFIPGGGGYSIYSEVRDDHRIF